MSWYLKYRPRQVADLDLSQVREHFQQLMQSGHFPHSFLFAGPKGTGKTSASRIIGALLNDPSNQAAVEQIFFSSATATKSKPASLHEPQLDSDFSNRVFAGHSLVVQEMDAASHRGIDDIRQLRERVYVTPQEGIISVYILDEVHMLTNEAFNALLKILEEPPAHVVFILATTELHKVPATIVSRCNLVSFYKAGLSEITQRLEKILKAEKIKFEEDALLEIARRADGSFRDAVKLTETVAQSGAVTLDNVEELIGGSALVEVKQLIELILAKDEAGISQVFQNLRQRHFDEKYFYQTLFDYLHQNLLGSLGALEQKPQLEQKVSRFLLEQLVKLDLTQASPIAYLPLELALLGLVQRAKKGQSGSGQTGSKAKDKTNNSKKEAKKPIKNTAADKNTVNQEAALEELVEAVEQNSSDRDELDFVSTPTVSANQTGCLDGDSSHSQLLCQRWEDFLKVVEQRNSTLAALLRSSQPQAGENGEAQVKVFYRFHQEQLQQPKFRTIIEECGQTIVGDKILFKFVLMSPPTEAEVVDVPAQTQNLEALAEEVLM